MTTNTNNPGPIRLTSYLPGNNPGPPPVNFRARLLIGILEGTGVGPQVIKATLQVLKVVEQAMNLKFEVRHGGFIGEKAVASCGKWLPEDTMEFCADIFQVGGAILSGPGGGRYVYDLRRRFDLFCKFVPVQPAPELARASRIAPRFLKNVDMLIVLICSHQKTKWLIHPPHPTFIHFNPPPVNINSA